MNFWIFQDKPNKRIAIHRSECGTRNVQQGPPSEGRSWHGPYSNYDEAFGKAKEMSPRKGAQINCRFCHPQYSPRQWDGERSRPEARTEKLIGEANGLAATGTSGTALTTNNVRKALYFEERARKAKDLTRRERYDHAASRYRLAADAEREAAPRRR
jgi:hypothetical protein